ncbi:hypothetical protein IH982_03410 [Patescibacteria group bacterium]|nr:hypothetical protein [Patescibacteria group bacterium]
MAKKIVVIQRGDPGYTDWYASTEEGGGIGAGSNGSTAAEAVGNLILNHSKLFDCEVEIK